MECAASKGDEDEDAARRTRDYIRETVPIDIADHEPPGGLRQFQVEHRKQRALG